MLLSTFSAFSKTTHLWKCPYKTEPARTTYDSDAIAHDETNSFPPRLLSQIYFALHRHASRCRSCPCRRWRWRCHCCCHQGIALQEAVVLPRKEEVFVSVQEGTHLHQGLVEQENEKSQLQIVNLEDEA